MSTVCVEDGQVGETSALLVGKEGCTEREEMAEERGICDGQVVEPRAYSSWESRRGGRNDLLRH